ncbi:MAG TPA: hypothetical protein PKA28_03585 [Methylomusa anaerophila]|uniref:Uncharacterized protein n=1 Tax=Methylomusa anaerophila TaxID=1930071 RepID=A0A348ANJ0_9FIRM|nr:hypothetical protein [Methylomusa anaerophila]BBB92638.1 hypothetical protein MAMMFC1_03333 [Methylomusa anaerophila]HML87509.1 hypothetical protein [Methylomusa anaerophila]
MEELLKQLLEGQKQLFEGQKQITQRLDRMESDITDLKTTVNNIEGQQAENTQYIKALVHRTEELDAKFDGLLVSTATKENIARLEAQTASKDDIAA